MSSSSSRLLPVGTPVRSASTASARSAHSSRRLSRSSVSKSIPSWLVNLGVTSKNHQLGMGFTIRDFVDYSKKSDLVKRIETVTGVHRFTALVGLLAVCAILYLVSLFLFPLNATSLLIVVIPMLVTRNVDKVELYWGLLLASLVLDLSIYIIQLRFPQVYTSLKTVLFAWIASPQTQGAVKIYKLAKKYDVISFVIPNKSDQLNMYKMLKRYSKRIEIRTIKLRRWIRTKLNLAVDDSILVDTDAVSYRDKFESESMFENQVRVRYTDLAAQELIETERLFTTQMVQLSADVIVPIFEESTFTMKWSSKEAETRILGFFQVLSELIPVHVRLNSRLQSRCYDRDTRVKSLKQMSSPKRESMDVAVVKRPQSQMTSVTSLPVFILPDALEYVIEELSNAMEVFNKYDEFALTYDAAIDLYRQELKVNKPFANYIKKHSKGLANNREPLEAFLIRPIQRICRYPLLLNSILKRLPPKSLALIEMHERVEDLYDRLNERVHQINREAGIARKMMRMSEVHSNLRVPGYPDATPILRALGTNQRLMQMDAMAHVKSPRERKGIYHAMHVFVYNDFIVLGSVKQESWRRQNQVYYYLDAIPLQGASVEAAGLEDNFEANNAKSSRKSRRRSSVEILDAVHVVKIITAKERNWYLGVHTELVFNNLLEAVQNSIEYSNRHIDSASTVYQLLADARSNSVVTEVMTGMTRVSKNMKGKFSGAFSSMRSKAATTVQRAYRGSVGRFESKRRKKEREAQIMAGIVIRKWLLKVRRQRRLVASGKVIRLQNSYTHDDFGDNIENSSSRRSSRSSTSRRRSRPASTGTSLSSSNQSMTRSSSSLFKKRDD